MTVFPTYCSVFSSIILFLLFSGCAESFFYYTKYYYSSVAHLSIYSYLFLIICLFVLGLFVSLLDCPFRTFDNSCLWLCTQPNSIHTHTNTHTHTDSFLYWNGCKYKYISNYSHELWRKNHLITHTRRVKWKNSACACVVVIVSLRLCPLLLSTSIVR